MRSLHARVCCVDERVIEYRRVQYMYVCDSTVHLGFLRVSRVDVMNIDGVDIVVLRAL